MTSGNGFGNFKASKALGVVVNDPFANPRIPLKKKQISTNIDAQLVAQIAMRREQNNKAFGMIGEQALKNRKDVVLN